MHCPFDTWQPLRSFLSAFFSVFLSALAVCSSSSHIFCLRRHLSLTTREKRRRRNGKSGHDCRSSNWKMDFWTHCVAGTIRFLPLLGLYEAICLHVTGLLERICDKISDLSNIHDNSSKFLNGLLYTRPTRQQAGDGVLRRFLDMVLGQ
jgi:hypothetical protein